MPTYTTLHQDSTTVLDSFGAPKFRVSSSITFVKDGDLPFADIFAHQIVDPLDPKQDKFLRVATVHDLSTILRGRDNAIANGKTTYLIASFLIEYTDINTAVAAKGVAQSRIDTLISDWIKFSTQFVVPTDFTLPAPEDTLVTAAKNAFASTHSARVAKEAALATANTTLADAKSAAARAATALADAMATTNVCQTRQGTLTSLITAYSGPTGYKTLMNALVTAAASAGFPPSGDAAFDAALAAAKTAITNESIQVSPLLTSLQTDITNECATETAAVQAAAAAKTTADTAVGTAQTAQALAQAAATAAAAAETTALAAVLAVCPNFDPNA